MWRNPTQTQPNIYLNINHNHKELGEIGRKQTSMAKQDICDGMFDRLWLDETICYGSTVVVVRWVHVMELYLTSVWNENNNQRKKYL